MKRPVFVDTAWLVALVDHADDIVPIESALLARSEQLYRRHDDKNWNGTDCISMEAMRDRGIRDVATTDSRFRQAGFRPLLAVGHSGKRRG